MDSDGLLDLGAKINVVGLDLPQDPIHSIQQYLWWIALRVEKLATAVLMCTQYRFGKPQRVAHKSCVEPVVRETGRQ